MLTKKTHIPYFVITIILSVLSLSIFITQTSSAAPTPVITLTFDDAWAGQYLNGASVLKSADQKATLYVPTSLVGTEGYMTWENIVEMVNDGWEIGGHSATHIELPLLTSEEMIQEVQEVFDVLDAHGLIPTGFATPYGAYTPEIIAQLAKAFSSHRGFHEIGYNTWPYNQYLLYVQQVTNQTTVADVEAWIQEAQTNNYWLIIVFHDILPTVAPEDTYSWTTTNLEGLMNFLTINSIKTKTIAEALNMKDSIIPNTDFVNGLSEGWTTDNPTQVIFDTENNGAIPTSESSIKMVGGSLLATLLSSTASVSNAIEYGVRVFINAINFTSGEFGLYVDEYDQNNQWISWKFLGIATPGFVIDESYFYVPTLSSVSFAGLRASMAIGSIGHVFLDNFSLFEMGEGDPLPIPSPVVYPNLPPPLPLPNTDFINGLSEGWTTDNPVQVVFDIEGNGITPTSSTSIQFTGDTSAAHLFSPQALIDSSLIYDLSFYADISTLASGELGFYIDEYDVNNNWVSGQWLSAAVLGQADIYTFSYTPTSTSVISASLQVYLTADSEGNGFIDNVEMVEAILPSPTPIPTINPNLPPPLPLPNTDFVNGLSEGWTTDNPTQTIFSTEDKGLAPTSSASIQFTGDISAAHLFSPQALIDSSLAYDINVYADTTTLIAGELGFYVDEYDTDGNWISGQWLGAAVLDQAGTYTFLYTPTSTSVISASLQVYLTAGSEGDGFVDNAEMIETIPPLPTPTPLPPAVLPLPNTDFVNGLSNGWTTDNSVQVVFDIEDNGITPTSSTSIQFTGDTSAAHLFSPQALIDSSLVYNINVYADTTTLIAGELGFYVDEYDVNNNWVSGQWLGAAVLGQADTYTFSYTPTLTSVISASLQVYLTASSEGDGFVDNAEMIETIPPLDPVALPLPNTDFVNGLSEGWTTDNPVQVVFDIEDNGIAPTSSASIQFIGDDSAAHLFSPQALIDSSLVYDINIYADVSTLVLGELGFYIDEYDTDSNWISGQWLGAAVLGQADTYTFSYTPTLTSVISASLQVYLTAGSEGDGFVDNAEVVDL